MNKRTIIIILGIFALNSVKAQDTLLDVFKNPENDFKKLKMRHVMKQQFLDGRCLYAHLGPAFELNYGYLITDDLQFHIGVNYEQGKINFSSFEYENLKLGVSYSVFKINRSIYINPDLSAFVGAMKATNSDLQVKDNYFNYGLSGGMNIEAFVLSKVSLLFIGEEQYNFKDKFGKWHYNVGVGIRVYIK